MRTRSLTLIAISVLIGVSACAQKQPNLKPKEISDKECQFEKKNVSGSPEDLVKDFLKRDGAGEFTIVSGWFDSVNLCPGHEGGPEVVYVVKNSKVEKTDVTQGRATAQVSYDVVGVVEPGANQSWHFVKNRKKQKRTFKLVHTAYGWRFRDVHLADGQYLSIKTAQARVSSKADKKALAAAETSVRKAKVKK